MKRQDIKTAAVVAFERGEDLQLAQAIEWMYEYKLITYKDYTTFLDAQSTVYREKTA